MFTQGFHYLKPNLVFMNIKTRLSTAAGLLVGAAVLWGGYQVDWTDSSDGNWQAHEVKQDPGWHQQWFDMRKNEDGKIPIGLYSKWSTHDQLYSGQRSTIFSNVTELGPFDVGGRTRALIIDYSDQDRILAGGVSGGLWISDDAGVNWTAVNDASPGLGITCITQDPFNNDVIYYGTGESSANSAGMPGEGIFKSTDGGLTFSQLSSTVNSDFTNNWSIKHSLTDANTLFVGTNNKGLWRSTDGGSSWTKVYTTSSRINDVETFPNGDIMIGVNGQGIFYSDDNGATFSELASSLPTSGFQRIELAYCQGTPATVYALYAASSSAPEGVYRSNDGGATWTQTVANPASTMNFSWYCWILGVHPTDPDKVFAGAQYDYYTTDGGTTWGTLSGSHADNHSYAFHESNPDEFLVGNDGGVYRYDWNSITSSGVDLNDGYHVTQFYAGYFFPGSSDDVIAGTQDNGTHSVVSGTWKKNMGGDGGYTAVSQQDGNLGYSEYQNGQIRRSTNLLSASPTYTSVYTQITSVDNTAFIAPYEINRADGQQVYFCSTNGIWRTNDSGTNWTKITNNHSTVYAVGVTNEADPTVYFGGSSAQLYRIDNASSAAVGTEVDLSASVPSVVTSHVISCITPHKSDNTKAYVTFSTISTQPRVYLVENINTASPTWTAIAGNLPSELPANWIEINPSNEDNLYVGTDFGLYSSEDGGTTWLKETEIPNTAVQNIRLRETDGSLFVFTHGRGAWSGDVPGFSSSQDYAAVPYSTGFESGLDTYWTTATSSTFGQVQTTTANTPHSGTNHLTFDVSTNGNFSQNEALLHLDLSGQTELELNFWWKEFNDENHTQDGVFLSDDGGSTFTKVFDLTGGTFNTYAEVTLDLDQLASDNGLILNSTFVVKFQQYDNYTITTDGIAIDDVEVRIPNAYATLPYATGFEFGSYDAYWSTASDNTNGRVQITDQNTPHSGTYHATMDVITNGTYATNESVLWLDLSAETDVTLNFWWKEFNDETHTQDGVFFSDDGGATFVKVFDLTNGVSNTWNEVTLDVDALAAANMLSLSGTFQIKFQQYDNFAITTDGIAIDDIEVYSGQPFAALPYNTGFEDGSFDSYWSTSSSDPNGRIQVTDQNTPHTGTYHATMDVITNGTYATNESWLHVDMAGESNVTLRFWWKEFGDETNEEDGVFISDDGGATFTKIFSLADGANNTWAEVTLDLSDLADANGLTHANNFVIKFQQYDNYAITTDGIAVDDIEVFIGSEPVQEEDQFQPSQLENLEAEIFTAVDDELSNEATLTIFPNPFRENLQVKLEGITQGAMVSVELLDAQGKVMLSKQVNYSGQIQLESDAVSAGVYFVRVQTGTDQWVQSVVKK